MIKLHFSPFSEGLDISCYFESQTIVHEDIQLTVGIVKISGTYPKGSAGNLSGYYLSSIGLFVRNYYELDAMIWDFSELKYEWGDGLRKTYNLPCLEFRELKDPDDQDWFGYVLVSGPNNHAALDGLICSFPCKENVSLHHTVNSGLLEIEESIKKFDWS